jgi:hypothetical protein
MYAKGLHFIGLGRVVVAIRYPAEIFTAEVTALFGAFRYIVEISEPPEK